MDWSKKFLHLIPILGRTSYFILLAILFTVGVSMRIGLPSIPFLDNDSWEYLKPALTQLFSGISRPTFRGFLYPFLVWITLSLHPTFTTLVFMQHGAGILAGVILLVAWHRMRIFLPGGVAVEVLHKVGGLVMTAMYLFSYISILMEHTIRPEAVFPLSIAICLWIATEFSRRVWLERRFHLQEVGLGIALIFFSFVGYYLKPAWGAGVLCAIVPLLIAAFGVRSHWGLKLMLFGVGSMLVYGLLAVPEERIHRAIGGNNGLRARILFSACGEIIYDCLREDARTLPPDAIQHKMLQSLDWASALRTRLFYGYTHLHPDDIFYRGPLNELAAHFGGSDDRVKADKVRSFCYEYYFRAWKRYPLRMLKKIWVQLWYFYSPKRSSVFDRRSRLNVQPRMQRSRQVLLDRPSYPWLPFQDYTNKVFALQETKQVLKIPRGVLFLGSILNAIYFPTLLLTIGALVALYFGWLGELEFKRGSLWALYLFSYNFGNSFTVAFVHVMGVTRYHFGQTLYSAISECFGCVLLLSLILTIASRQIRRRLLTRASSPIYNAGSAIG